MTVMAAVTLGGLFTGCNSVDADVNGGNDSAEFNVVQNYENAFVTRFGQPAANQTWGFGPAASVGTRGVVPQPSVSRIGYSFNATMTMGANAASAAGLDAGSYSIWAASGWEDEVYRVNGTVDASNISGKLKAAIVNKIVGTDANPGLIPEGSNNLGKANSLGYSVVTTERGPVTLTPVYHQSSSGDPIYYYYYPKGTNPDVKKLKKYSIGYMADPNVCINNINALNENTYSLVYVDESGNVSYDFPADMVISFIVSNVDYKYPSTPVDVYEPGATNLNLVGRYALEAGETILSGTEKDVIDGKVRVKFGNSTLSPQFDRTETEEDNYFNIWGNRFNSYYKGNGVNGSLNAGSTCYYLKAVESGYLWVVVRVNDVNNLKVYEVGDDWDSTDNKVVTPAEKPSNNTTGVCKIKVSPGKVYAVYAENEQLCFYGYALLNDGQSQILESNAVPGGWGPDNCGTIYQNAYSTYNKVYLKLGKATNPIYFNQATGNHPIENFPYLTEGNGNNGGFGADATTYFIRPKQNGVIRAAVKLSGNNTGNYKTLKVIDLGEWGWYNTSGNELLSETNNSTESIYGTYDFDVEANHVYAVYAEGSKRGFYGCEFLTKSSSTGGTKTIDNHPEFYGDGNYNTAVHTSQLGWTVDPSTTPHAAVFNTELTDEDGKKFKVSLIGFEDWIDLDFNDVIFAVTGAEPEVEQPPVIIEVPDDPEGFVCRIIAEDLTVGENSDFDFNDVVFDVYWSGGVTTIRLLAAGGELPLYIGSVDAAHEVHNLLGFPNSYPLINTNWKEGKTANPVEFTISGTYSNRAACKNIPIYVTKKGENIQLKADQGKVASMVAVGLDYEWCDERTDIDKKFRAKDGTKLFQQYVIGKLGDDWDGNKAWYQYRGKELPND